MSKVTIAGDAIILTSTITVDEFVNAKKYYPETTSLSTFDEQDKRLVPIFAIDLGETEHISEHGIVFANYDCNDHLMLTTTNPCRDHEDPEKEFEIVTDAFAKIISRLNKIERNINNASEDIRNIKDEVENSIEYLAPTTTTETPVSTGTVASAENIIYETDPNDNGDH